MNPERQLRKMMAMTSVGQLIKDIEELSNEYKVAASKKLIAKQDGIHREKLNKATELARYALGRNFWLVDSPFAISWRDRTVVFWVAGADVIDALVIKGFQVDGGYEDDLE